MTSALRRWMTLKLFTITRQPVRPLQTTYFVRKVLGCASLGIAIAKCDGDAKVIKLTAADLTYEQCIKQACLLSANSASTLLTTTSSALLEICKEYKETLNRVLSLLEEVNDSEEENPLLWDAVVEARGEANRAKSDLVNLTSYMLSVEKVVESTTEAAFLAGADYMCTALCERLYLAKKEIENHVAELKILEDDYIKLQCEMAKKKETENKGKSTNKAKVQVVSGKKEHI